LSFGAAAKLAIDSLPSRAASTFRNVAPSRLSPAACRQIPLDQGLHVRKRDKRRDTGNDDWARQ